MGFLKRTKNPIVAAIHDVLLSMGFEGSLIMDILADEYTLKVNLKLPSHADLDDLEQILQNLKMEMGALDVKFGKMEGKKVEVLFGMRDLCLQIVNKENIEEFLTKNTLKIMLPSAYGCSTLDFEDGASCHLLNGGTTRMGKTCLLLYLCTVLYLQNKGKVQFLISSTKIKDFYPFAGLDGVKFARTEGEVYEELESVIKEYKRRDDLLHTTALRKATDSKSVKELYPGMYKHFRPIFVVIDEYARFADNREIQKQVMELVESAGYVNVHVIIASQRPDARTVLPPRIKTNLLARICFTTADANNSIVILDREGAEKLGKIKGRAIYLDSETNVIQVPYLDVTVCDELLEPYRKGGEDGSGRKENESGPGCRDQTLINKVQGLFKESVGPYGFSEEYQSSECDEQGDEEALSGWFRLASKEGEG